ncbi:MAG TPA: PepSY domain-containing protein [Acidobacteriaceae bacterium]
MSHPSLLRVLPIPLLALVAAAGLPSAHAESHVPCHTLPDAVLSHAKAEAGGATIRSCVKEKEDGKLTYEVETVKDGKSRDLLLDASGSVVEVEQEVTPDSLPAAVADAIAKAAHGGKVGRIESVTRGDAIANYETTITSRGQRREVAFTPQGARAKAD